MNRNRNSFYVRSAAAIFSVALVLAWSPSDWHQRFRLLVDVQIGSTCLPVDVMLLDLKAPFSRGDLVAAQVPEKTIELNRNAAQFPYVGKLVVAIAGDHLVIKSHQVWVNGVYVSSYSQFLKSYMREKAVEYSDMSLTVPAGYAFVMGNSPTAVDSRVFGLIATKTIAGRAYAII